MLDVCDTTSEPPAPVSQGGSPSPDEIRRHFARPAHCVLGVLLDPVTSDGVMSFIADSARDGRHVTVATPNVNDLVRAPRDSMWRHALLKSSLSIVDGMPLVWIARILDLPIRRRLAGSDLFDALRAGQAGPLTIMFYGGPPGIAAAACRAINAERGSLTALGGIDPGFGSVDELGAPHLIAEVNAANPDMLILGLGAKGKPWIDAHAHKINRGIVTHLGAVLNFAAGSVRRAPKIFRKLGIEWAWRIVEEPVLWRRYGQDGVGLLWIVLTRLVPLWLTNRRRPPGGRGRVSVRMTDDGTTSIAVSGPLDEGAVAALRSSFAAAAERRHDVALDLRDTTTLDTTAAGLLLLAFGMQLRTGREIRITGSNDAIRRRLAWHGCSDLF